MRDRRLRTILLGPKRPWLLYLAACWTVLSAVGWASVSPAVKARISSWFPQVPSTDVGTVIDAVACLVCAAPALFALLERIWSYKDEVGYVLARTDTDRNNRMRELADWCDQVIFVDCPMETFRNTATYEAIWKRAVLNKRSVLKRSWNRLKLLARWAVGSPANGTRKADKEKQRIIMHVIAPDENRKTAIVAALSGRGLKADKQLVATKPGQELHFAVWCKKDKRAVSIGWETDVDELLIFRAEDGWALKIARDQMKRLGDV